MIIDQVKEKVNSPFLRKILKGTFFLSIGSISSRALLALAYIIMARILTKEEYGEYGMIKSTIDNFLIFASMGIGLTTTKYVSELKNIDKQATSSILGNSILLVFFSSLLIFFLILIFSDYISSSVLKNSDLRWLLVTAGGILIFVSLNGTQLGALLGFQSYKETAIVNIFQGILIFTGLTGGAYLFGLKGAVLGNLIALCILNIITQFYLRKECLKNGLTISLQDWKKNIKKIYKFAIPASLSTIIVAPTIWILNTILVNQPDGYTQLGIYSAVIIFSTAIQMINGSLSNALLPIFLTKDTDVTPKKEFFNYFGAWFISILLALPIILFPELVSLILGPKYPVDIVKIVLSLSVVSTLIVAYKQGISRDLVIKNKMWLSVFSMGQWAIVSLILFCFLKKHGAVGFAISYCIGYIVNFFIFVPFFIYNKISPLYIFFTKEIWLIWGILIILISINIFCSSFYIRIPISIIFIFILIFNFMNFYKKITYN